MTQTELPFAPGLPPSAGYDEMVTGRGIIRRHWRAVVAELGSIPGGLAERVDRARRHFDEDGVTYTIYGDQSGRDRPWSFDPVPLVLSAGDWAHLEAGVAQRAQLLDAVLADLYGPQRLIAERVLPPGIVFGNPEFLRSCRGAVAPSPGRWLPVYAVDLARSADGRWTVLADRCQSPAGAGYALQNRRVLARTLPEGFRTSLVRRLPPFFARWQAALQRFAPRPSGYPRAVLLTPGRLSESYFEHAFLASEMALDLAEGADLTMRDGHVYLKTLAGLQPVDVILRRVDSAFCDPLELRSDSVLGTVGLVAAARAGTVAVANAIGSGLAEMPALLPFLPRAARLLLGQDLALPTVPTHWLGRGADLAAAPADTDRYVFRPALHGETGSAFDEADTPAEPPDAIARLRRNPRGYVAQHRLLPSSAPCWTPEGLVPRPVVLRLFAIAEEGGYAVMPGGLARIPPGENPLGATFQHGSISKDVWVLAQERRDIVVAGPARPAPAEIRRSSGNLPSRVADDLFWLGRYVERLDMDARLLRAALRRLVSADPGPRHTAELGLLAHLLGRAAVIPRDLAGTPPDGGHLAEGLANAVDAGRPLDLLLADVHRLGGALRDRLAEDTWQTLAHLVGNARHTATRAAGDVDQAIAALDQIVRLTTAFVGLMSETMTRGDGWRFHQIGRRLERGVQTSRLIANALAPSPDPPDVALRLILELAQSLITYRSRYMAAFDAGPVLDLAVADLGNPRAVAYQLADIRVLIGELSTGAGPADGTDDLTTDARRLAAGLPDAVRDNGVSAAVGPLLEICERLMKLSDTLTRDHFTLVPRPHMLGPHRRT